MRMGMQRNRTPASPETVLNRPPFLKRLLRFTCLAFAVIAALEVFVFNYQSFVLLGRGYEEHSYSAQDARFVGLLPVEGKENTYYALTERPTIEFTEIDQEIGTFHLKLEPLAESRRSMDIDFLYTDDTRPNYYTVSNAVRLYRGVERSQYETCSLFGTSNKVMFRFSMAVREEIQFEGLTINETVPFHFSVLRILTLLAAAVFVFCMLKCPSYQCAYDEKSIIQQRSFWLATVGMLFLFTVVYFLYIGNPSYYAAQPIQDQLSLELVEAFKAGQVSLLTEPSQKLINAPNPYGDRAGIDFLWDHLYYNGKYYSYYGIAPVILFYLPFNLITGSYLPSMVACFLFAIAAAVFLAMAYRVIIRNWFSKTPFNLVLCGLIMLLLAAGILPCISRPKFYEAAETSALMFFALGLYFMVSSGVFTKSRVKRYKLFLSAVFVSLAVLSRPTFALYAVAMLIWLFYALRQFCAELPKGVKKGGRVFSFLAASLLPYAVFGGIQMAYNYVRFGSPFDFGIQYSLTINDFTRTQLRLSLAGVSLWNFLFGTPNVTTQFPFLTGNKEMWGVIGYYFFDFQSKNIIFGIFWRFLPLFALLYAPYALRRLPKGRKTKALLLGGVGGMLIPLIIIAATWESGHALRYNVDFAWQMLLVALAIVFFAYNRIQNPRLRLLLTRVFVFCTVSSVIANLLLTAMAVPGVSNTVYKNPSVTMLYYKLSMLFEFWA